MNNNSFHPGSIGKKAVLYGLSILFVAIIAGVIYLLTYPSHPEKVATVEETPIVVPVSTGVTTSTFPVSLETSYISPVEWPPHIEFLDQPFVCNVTTESEITSAGKTEKRAINGIDYCITTTTEGAAGSTYRHYIYTFAQGKQTATLTFTLRFVECGNYDETEKSVCEEERALFNPDELVIR